MAERDQATMLPERLQGLLLPGAYPHPVSAIRVVQTHVSWVLLTGEFAYKLKRPVHYDFIDLRDPQRRAALCEVELRLNQRFSPSLYVAVCDVRWREGRAHIGGEGELLERAVCMRQFTPGCELDALLRGAQVDGAQIESFARSLASIHARLPVAAGESPWGQPDRIAALLHENLREARQSMPDAARAAACDALAGPLDRALQRVRPVLGERRAAGYVRECHGDLHARNIALHEGRLQAFDCLEFEPAFRWIDVAEDVACLTMDLLAHGRADLAAAFTHGWLLASGDFSAARVLRLYGAHRALVRAKVMALEQPRRDDARAAGDEPRAGTDADAYLSVAARLLGDAAPLLVLMHGVSGSGKSWFATRLAARHRLLHLRSDVERKRLAGLPPEARTASPLDGGLYTPEGHQRVRDHLLAAAESVLTGGLGVIVDATLLRVADRRPWVELARRLGVRCVVVACHASPETLRSRLLRREQVQQDPSEAGLAVLQAQQQRVEPCAAAEGAAVVAVATDDPDAIAQAGIAVNAYVAGAAGMY